MKLSRRTLITSALATVALPGKAVYAGDDGVGTLFETFMRDKRAPGLQYAIVKDGRLHASGAMGVAHLESGAAVNAETLFPINSATKPFTGVAIMQLHERGLIDLEAPVSAYLHDLPPAWSKASVTHCLAHCSGLPNIVDRGGLIGTAGEAEAWTLVQSLPLEFSPGARFSYNQTNYLLLGRLLAQFGKAPFQEVIATGQFKPTGMARTRFGDTFDVIPNSAQPYSYYRRVRGQDEVLGDAVSRWADDMPVFLRAGGGIYSNATELASWMIALAGGKLLTKHTSVARMATAPTLADGKPSPFALGWPLWPVNGRAVLSGIGGGRAAFCIWPKSKAGIVVLTNLVGANPENILGDVAKAAALT